MGFIGAHPEQGARRPESCSFEGGPVFRRGEVERKPLPPGKFPPGVEQEGGQRPLQGESVVVRALANDNDPLGAALGIEYVGKPLHGSVSVNDAGTPSDPSDDWIVYAPAQPGEDRSLVWVTRQGTEEPLAAPARAYAQPRLSPNGKRVAVATVDREIDIVIWDLNTSRLTSVTSGPEEDICPVWTRDGRRLVFSSTREGVANIFWQVDLRA